MLALRAETGRSRAGSSNRDVRKPSERANNATRVPESKKCKLDIKRKHLRAAVPACLSVNSYALNVQLQIDGENRPDLYKCTIKKHVNNKTSCVSYRLQGTGIYNELRGKYMRGFQAGDEPGVVVLVASTSAAADLRYADPEVGLSDIDAAEADGADPDASAAAIADFGADPLALDGVEDDGLGLGSQMLPPRSASGQQRRRSAPGRRPAQRQQRRRGRRRQETDTEEDEEAEVALEQEDAALDELQEAEEQRQAVPQQRVRRGQKRKQEGGGEGFDAAAATAAAAGMDANAALAALTGVHDLGAVAAAAAAAAEALVGASTAAGTRDGHPAKRRSRGAARQAYACEQPPPQQLLGEPRQAPEQLAPCAYAQQAPHSHLLQYQPHHHMTRSRRQAQPPAPRELQPQAHDGTCLQQQQQLHAQHHYQHLEHPHPHQLAHDQLVAHALGDDELNLSDVDVSGLDDDGPTVDAAAADAHVAAVTSQAALLSGPEAGLLSGPGPGPGSAAAGQLDEPHCLDPGLSLTSAGIAPQDAHAEPDPDADPFPPPMYDGYDMSLSPMAAVVAAGSSSPQMLVGAGAAAAGLHPCTAGGHGGTGGGAAARAGDAGAFAGGLGSRDQERDRERDREREREALVDVGSLVSPFSPRLLSGRPQQQRGGMGALSQQPGNAWSMDFNAGGFPFSGTGTGSFSTLGLNILSSE